MAVAEVYARNVHKQTKYYYAHWLPNSPISIGVVGTLENRVFFRPKTTLKDLGIDFDAARDIEQDADSSPMKLVSNRGVNVTIKAAGELNPKLPNVPQGSAGIGLEFERQAAFMLQAEKSYEPRIRDVVRLEEQIKRAIRDGRWQRNFAVIYSLVHMPYADILISESKNSFVELQAQADGQVGSIELGKSSLQFALKSQSGTVRDMRGCQNVTPLFQLVGIQDRLVEYLQPTRIGSLNHNLHAGPQLTDSPAGVLDVLHT